MNRDKHERRIARIISKALQETLKEVMRDAAPDTDISAEVWARLRARLKLDLQPELHSIAMEAAREMNAGIDFDLVNKDAQAWASQYSFELVRDVVDKRSGEVNTRLRDVLRDSIAAGFNKGQTNEKIAEALAPYFGPERAANIAVTEVTRAAVQGEKTVVDELRSHGVNMAAYWITVRDTRVCPICEPRDKTKQGDGWDDLPPAHPRCRCMIRWEYVKRED